MEEPLATAGPVPEGTCARPPTVPARPRDAWFILALIVALVGYFVLLQYWDRTLFSPRPGRLVDEPDGFEQTIRWAQEDSDVPPWLLLRLLVVYPMLVFEDTLLATVAQGSYLLLYSLPVVFWNPPGHPRRKVLLGLVLLPVFMNFRLAMGVYVLVYLFACVCERRIRWGLVWFALPMALSTSTMWVFCALFAVFLRGDLRRTQSSARWFLYLAFVAMLSQFVQKMYALLERSLAGEALSNAAEVGVDAQGAIGFVGSLISGNPIVMSLLVGQYDRLVLLLGALAVGAAVMVVLWRRGRRREVAALAVLATSLLGEGIGAYSIPMVVLVVIAHWKFFGRRTGLRPTPLSRHFAAPASSGH